jgi:hypothetical protein
VVVGPPPPNATFRRSREAYFVTAPGKLMQAPYVDVRDAPIPYIHSGILDSISPDRARETRR